MVSVPRETPLAKNWTLDTMPSASAAVAVTVVAAPTPTVPAAGAVRVAVGDWLAATLRVTGALVVWLPTVSVATAVRA